MLCTQIYDYFFNRVIDTSHTAEWLKQSYDKAFFKLESYMVENFRNSSKDNFIKLSESFDLIRTNMDKLINLEVGSKPEILKAQIWNELDESIFTMVENKMSRCAYEFLFLVMNILQLDILTVTSIESYFPDGVSDEVLRSVIIDTADKLLYEDGDVLTSLRFYQILACDTNTETKSFKYFYKILNLQPCSALKSLFTDRLELVEDMYRCYEHIARPFWQDMTSPVMDIMVDLHKQIIMLENMKLSPILDRVKEVILASVRYEYFIYALRCLEQEKKVVHRKYVDSVNACTKEYSYKYSEDISRCSVHSKSKYEMLQYAFDISCIVIISWRIKGRLKIRQITEPVAYYTSLQTFRKMLPENHYKDKVREGAFIDSFSFDSSACSKLCILPKDYMNDPNEGNMLPLALFGKDKVESIDLDVSNDKYVFVKCFTTRIDDLPMWEMYGQHGEGCCIVIDFNSNDKFITVRNTDFFKVCYLQKINQKYVAIKGDNFTGEDVAVINKYLGIVEDKISIHRENDIFYECVLSIIDSLRYLFKDSVYSHENEIRLIVEKSDTGKVKILNVDKDYPLLAIETEKPIKIESVILGPKVHDINIKIPYIQSQMNLYIKKLVNKFVPVKVSKVAIR